MRKNLEKNSRIGDYCISIFTYLFFILFTLVCTYPFYYIFINTISNNKLSDSGFILFAPQGVHFNNYTNALRMPGLFRAAQISVARTVIGTALTVLFAGFLGFMFSRVHLWKRRFWYRIIIITMYFNAGVIPWYLTMRNLGLTNNFWGYVFPAMVTPFFIILTKTYIESIPKELQESAEIDGAGILATFIRIILPVSKPILATIAIFSAIMDEFDPKRKVALIVDEWGTWYEVEPGTNPGFLYQQNTLRDAFVAGIHFDIFNNNCERVSMANIAQTINVLQSVILTEGAKMVLTPTYHAYDMYKVHHDAVKLPVHVESEGCSFGNGSLPAVSASASESDNGKINISMTNIDLKNEQMVYLDLRGVTAKPSGGRIITSEKMSDHNNFDHGDKVRINGFYNYISEGAGNKTTVILPPKSVVTLELS